MKKIFMIHQNTKPIRLTNLNQPPENNDVYVQIATDFVVTVGWIKTKEEQDPQCGEEYTTIYTDNTEYAAELNQYLPGVYFDTYEDGCKVLVRILRDRTNNDTRILNTYNALVEQFPEAAI